MHSATHDAIAAAWRIDSAKVVAVVARMVREHEFERGGRRYTLIDTAGVRRRGKYLLAKLDDGSSLLLHLGMTGQLRLRPGERSQRDAGRRHPDTHRSSPQVAVLP